MNETKHRNKVAYYLDMGLGKTFVGSEKANSFPQKILVICQKSKIRDWTEHFRKYYLMPVFDLAKDKQLNEYINANEKCVGVINYDLVFRRPCFQCLTDFTLILDESSIIQNETTKRSRFILGMHPENIILLSGTPTAGKYENLWSQIHLLGWDISKERYWEHYVDVEWIEDLSGFRIPHVVGYKNVDRLKSKLAEYGAVFMKSDEAFALPEQIDIPVMVPTSDEYKRFMRKSIVTVGSRELIGDTVLTKRLYARMLCGQYSTGKAQAFEDLIESTNDRLIVFYNFNDELSLLWKIASKKTEHLSIVNGSQKDLEAYSQWDDSITFCQYQAGAMGLNLQLANRICYYSLPERSELFEQSKKRIHRIGQEKTCFYHYLLCENSVEMNILKTLEKRRDYTDDLFKEYENENVY